MILFLCPVDDLESLAAELLAASQQTGFHFIVNHQGKQGSRRKANA